MSAARARRRRGERNMTEFVMQAHDRLHKDDVDGAHLQLHAALGIEDAPAEVAPLTQRVDFDAAFRDLCTRSGTRAAYVLIDRYRPTDGAARLCSGGDADLVEIIDKAVRSGA